MPLHDAKIIQHVYLTNISTKNIKQRQYIMLANIITTSIKYSHVI